MPNPAPARERPTVSMSYSSSFSGGEQDATALYLISFVSIHAEQAPVGQLISWRCERLLDCALVLLFHARSIAFHLIVLLFLGIRYWV